MSNAIELIQCFLKKLSPILQNSQSNGFLGVNYDLSLNQFPKFRIEQAPNFHLAGIIYYR